MDFVQVNGKKLKKGYSTGATATAALKAASLLLINGEVHESIELTLLSGRIVTVPVLNHELIDENTALCTCQKYGGDDIDVTKEARVSVVLKITDGKDIVFKAGSGVGTVTRKGLASEVGGPAINPGPRKMMTSVFRSIYSECGAEIEVSVEGGEEMALRTMNSKLGVLGGISILGTTGEVIPMSEDAFKSSLALDLKQRFTTADESYVFTPGNYGIEFSKRTLGYKEERIIKISNFVGYMLDEARLLGIKKIILVGHVGKLIKIAGGNFHTHSRVSDSRHEILISALALEGIDIEVLREIRESNTMDESVDIVKRYNLLYIFDDIAMKIKKKAKEYTYGEIDFEVVLFNLEKEKIGCSGV